MVKNCDRGLENAARAQRPRAAFFSWFFIVWTDPKPANWLTSWFLYQTLSTALDDVPSTHHRKKSNERTNE